MTTGGDQDETRTAPAERMLSIRLIDEQGRALGDGDLVLGDRTTPRQLEQLANQLLGAQAEDDDDDGRPGYVPIAFHLETDGRAVDADLATVLARGGETGDGDKKAQKLLLDYERTLRVVYAPQAVFRVRTVTRCTATLPGHAQPVTIAAFSPDGRELASGSGDCTVRLWDTALQLPRATCTGHPNWIMCVAWAPDGKRLASACRSGQILLWETATGNPTGIRLSARPASEDLKRREVGAGRRVVDDDRHRIMALAWEPFVASPSCRRLASGGRDACIHIWDTRKGGRSERTLAGHTACVTAVKWGGEGLLYSASQDRTVKVWRVDDGVLCRSLAGHAHWVNTLALNTDYALRTGPFEPIVDDMSAKKKKTKSEGGEAVEQERSRVAARRYAAARAVCGGERLVSGSDDFTLFLWNPAEGKQPIARMTGHQQLVNQVVFSPDARLVASASFDKSIKLWCGRTGRHVGTLRGHVAAVYQVAWSSDSRLLLSGSADSTLKVWSVASQRLHFDLPGHGDAVYTVDWAPDGGRAVSGGKDKALKMWSQ